MDWPRFLQIARCPRCFSTLLLQESRLGCSNGHRFPVNDLGIPVFAQPILQTLDQLIEEEEAAAAYAGMRSFAARALGRGESEGLYRTVNDLLQQALRGRAVASLLDLGCGTGRTLIDAAIAFPTALVAGLDRDPAALTIAYAAACLSGPAVTADLRRWGFGFRTWDGAGLGNVVLVQAQAGLLPFASDRAWHGFDAIISVNLLDRVDDPGRVLDASVAVLRPGGSLVLTTPLNWRDSDGLQWESLADLAGLCSALERRGLLIDEAFDGLVYRETQDQRGSALDWRVAAVRAHLPEQ